jgi:hypothetical protein
VRPSTGLTPSAVNRPGEAMPLDSPTGPSGVDSLKCQSLHAPNCSTVRLRFSQSSRLRGETTLSRRLFSGFHSPRATSRPASGKGRGRSSTPFMKLKMAVFAPIPSASVSTATAEKPGFFKSERQP